MISSGCSYARASEAFSYVTGEKMVHYTDDQIIGLILEKYQGRKLYLLAPVVKGRKGHYKELFEQILKKGFISARIDGEIKELRHGMRLDRYKTHNIEILIDKVEVNEQDRKRLRESVKTAMDQGKGIMMVLEKDTETPRFFSRQLMCPTSGISYNEPAPHSFSFNSPQGACPRCNGLGIISEIDISRIIPDPTLSIRKGAIKPLGALQKFTDLLAAGIAGQKV